MTKEKLIEKLMEGVLPVGEIRTLEEEFRKLKEFDFRPLVKRIFDLNEGPIINHSTAQKGFFNWMNKQGRNKKNKKFKKNIKTKRNNKVIVAEGDSWFEYPIFIKDIVDWLIDTDKYSIYSIASGGDWIGNILYRGKYISELSLYQPDVFLISGGGNDLVGDYRIALLVKKRKYVDVGLNSNDQNMIKTLITGNESQVNATRIVVGKKFLTKDFWALLNVFRFQYFIIFQSIRSSNKFDNMKIITQGYDYPIASSNKNIFKNPLRLLFGNGQWVDYPLSIRGIYSQEEKNCIISAMIYEFNNMIIDVGGQFEKVFHIDCRGLSDEDSWMDELHLKSRFYKIISKKYIECIESTNDDRRIFKVYK